MANPSEITTVIANGMTFANWTSVEIERSYALEKSLATYMELRTVEVETRGRVVSSRVAPHPRTNDQDRATSPDNW